MGNSTSLLIAIQKDAVDHDGGPHEPKAAITAAATAARSTMPDTDTCSCRAWAPSPTAPSPSSTGTPRRRRSCRRWRRPPTPRAGPSPAGGGPTGQRVHRAMSAFGSMTGRFQPPRTAISARGHGPPARAAARRSAARAAAGRTRTSTSASAVPGDDVGRVPPLSTPTLTVVPAAGSAAGAAAAPAGRSRRSHWRRLRIQARVRLDPTRRRPGRCPTPLRAGLHRTVARRLEDQRRRGVGALLLDHRAGDGLPISSSPLSTSRTRRPRHARRRAAPAAPTRPAPDRPSCRTRPAR